MNHDEKLLSVLGEAIGEASMCWTEIPAGVFDSDKALAIANRLMTLVELKEKEPRAYLGEPLWAFLTPLSLGDNT